MFSTIENKTINTFPYSGELRFRTMRTYIFTEHERRIILRFLAGEKVDRLDIGRIKSRVRKFRATLESDIVLFQKMAENV